MKKSQLGLKAIDTEILLKISLINGVLCVSKSIDGTGTLIVYVMKDTQEVRKAVLQIIDDKIPADKVVFIETGEFVPLRSKR